MAIKDILVQMDRSPAALARLDMAIALAQQHQAHLTGLFVEATTDRTDFTPGQAERDSGEPMRTAAQRLGTYFDEKTARAEISAEWRWVDPTTTELLDVAEEVILHGRYNDLVIVGQYDPEERRVPADFPDRLVLGVGVPVLLIPYSGRFDLGEMRAMVAWNAGREAVRAVNDALPFLERAVRTVVLAVNPLPSTRNGHGEIPCADICTHLARHGVAAEAQHIAAQDIRVGDALLSRAADEGVNLLVAGAYQRSRMREIVLGGVTHHLLQQMTVPILMSH